MRKIILIIHNVRSAYNVGSLLRTADGMGVSKVYMSGYTPYPQHQNDSRLPHIAKRVDRQIKKSALGTEDYINWESNQSIEEIIERLKTQDFEICGLEQNKNSAPLNRFRPGNKVALIVGNEVNGLDANILRLTTQILEIPMLGKKESFNVAQAAAMALFYFKYSL